MRQASGSYCRIRVDLCSKIVPLKIYNAKEFFTRSQCPFLGLKLQKCFHSFRFFPYGFFPLRGVTTPPAQWHQQGHSPESKNFLFLLPRQVY